MSAVAVGLLEEELASVNKTIAEKVGDMVDKRDALVDAIKKLSRGTGKAQSKGTAASIDEATLLETVREMIDEETTAVTSSEIASALGVDTRAIARKLAKMADDGVLAGDKTAGYAVA